MRGRPNTDTGGSGPTTADSHRARGGYFGPANPGGPHDGGLDSVVQRAGGLDTEHDWPMILSLGEQQQLAVIRLILARPSFALLDRVSSALGPALLQPSLRRLTASSITDINFDQVGESELLELYDAVLQINANGAWSWKQFGPVDSGPASR